MHFFCIFIGENKLTYLDSKTGVFLWNLRNLQEYLFYRTPPMAASVWSEQKK